MPVDITGRNRADLLMEPGSVISRMNPGRIYEHYVAGMSRRCKHMILEKYGEDFSKYTPAAIEDSFNIILGLLELIGTEQYTAYKAVKTLEDKAAIVQEAVEKEVYLYYKISSEKKPYQIVLDTIKAAASGTSYEPIVDKVKFRRLGKEYVTKEPVMISPQYTILLNKTAETYLSVAGARVNHFGFPISVGNTSKYRLPHRPNPVKALSETETRLYTSYVSQRGILELKDRANSIKTHEALYKNILDAPMPTNIDSVVDRSKVPYGEDSALQLVNNIFNAAGLEMDWVPDRTIIHEPLKGEKS